jgi:hypothetical protein
MVKRSPERLIDGMSRKKTMMEAVKVGRGDNSVNGGTFAVRHFGLDRSNVERTGCFLGSRPCLETAIFLCFLVGICCIVAER